MTVSIVIATRDRREDLRRTLSELSRLDPKPLEILICADGCTDGTAEMVRREFPACLLLQNDIPRGSVPSRDRMMRAASGEFVLSLDDDSHPVAADFLARAVAVMGSHPEAAVITFPELRDGGAFASERLAEGARGHYVGAYPNCSALMRRCVYLQCSGFPPAFFHMYEEPDYALQCYAAGHAVWFEPACVIRHHRSASNRSSFRAHQLNARNEMWSVWLRCPWPWLPVVALFRAWRQLRYAATEGLYWALREPVWWLSALRGAVWCIRLRKRVRWAIYYEWMNLARKPAFDIDELERRFPGIDARA